MACAERFSNVKSIATLNSTQMIALLSLPDAEKATKCLADVSRRTMAKVEKLVEEATPEIKARSDLANLSTSRDSLV